MIKLTSPNGEPIYLRGDDIFAVHADEHESRPEAKSAIVTSSGVTIFVREIPTDVIKKLGG